MSSKLSYQSPPDIPAMQDALVAFIKAAGLNLAHPDLAQTPQRVSELWQNEFLSGYQMDPHEILNASITNEADPDAIIIRQLAYHSLCPHHLLPFQGVALVAYKPQKKIVGFGRIAQLVACFTQRLTLQEQATIEIAEALMHGLNASAVACILESKQHCLGIPGDRHANHSITTSCYLGDPKQKEELRKEVGTFIEKDCQES